jgi:DNA repair protein RadC
MSVSSGWPTALSASFAQTGGTGFALIFSRTFVLTSPGQSFVNSLCQFLRVASLTSVKMFLEFKLQHSCQMDIHAVFIDSKNQ